MYLHNQVLWSFFIHVRPSLWLYNKSREEITRTPIDNLIEMLNFVVETIYLGMESGI